MMFERNLQLSTSTSAQNYNHLCKPTPYHSHRKIAEKSRKRNEALWIDYKDPNQKEDGTPFRFTGKERDLETGLYYYGARYLDPKTSRWMSADPAMGEYIPTSGQDIGKLSGMGGVYNTVNLHTYHYAANNPVKYVDPDGRDSIWEIDEQAKKINIIIPVEFKGVPTDDERQAFYDAAKNWEGEFAINVGLARGNLNDFSGEKTYSVTMNIIEVDENNRKEFDKVNTVTFDPMLRSDKGGQIPNVKKDKHMTIYFEEYLEKVITHEIGHLLGLDDRYIEKERDINGNRNTPPRTGWGSNIMANSYYGSVDKRNFNEALLHSANKIKFKK